MGLLELTGMSTYQGEPTAASTLTVQYLERVEDGSGHAAVSLYRAVLDPTANAWRDAHHPTLPLRLPGGLGAEARIRVTEVFRYTDRPEVRTEFDGFAVPTTLDGTLLDYTQLRPPATPGASPLTMQAARDAITRANDAATNANALGSTLIPQAALTPGGLQALINKPGRGSAVGYSGTTTLPLNGQIIVTEDLDLSGTQGVRYFDQGQAGIVTGGSVLRGAPGLPQIMEVRGRAQHIAQYGIDVDVGAFGIDNIELAGGYDFSGAGNHTGAVDGIVFTPTTGPMRPITSTKLIARGFDAAIRVIPRIIGVHPDGTGNGTLATYQTSIANVTLFAPTLTGNRYSLYAEGWSSVLNFKMLNGNIERGGRVHMGDQTAAGRIVFEQTIAELNHDTFRMGAGQHGATFEFRGTQFEANTGYFWKLLGDPDWRTKAIITDSAFNPVDEHPVAQLTQLRAEIDEPTLTLACDRVQLAPGCRYAGLTALREIDAAWTYVLSPAAELLGQPDQNVYLGAHGVFGSAATNVAMTPLGRVGTYNPNTIQPWDLGQVPNGGLVKFSMLARSKTGNPALTGLLVADGGGGYVPVNQDLRIRLLPEWQILTIVVRAGQAFYGGQIKLTSPDVEYSSVHVGVQGSDKTFRPYYPTASFS